MYRGLLALALFGCGRVGFDAATDGARSGSPDSLFASCTWSPPEIFDVLDSVNEDWEPTLSPDGQTIIFSSDRTGTGHLFIAQRSGATWMVPTQIGAPLASSQRDFGPELNRAGNRLYFASDRTLTSHLYVADFDQATGAFGTPALLVGLEGLDAGSPTVSADERELIYTVPSVDASYLGRATRPDLQTPWHDEGPYAALNSASGRDGWPTLSADDLTIVFESARVPGVDLVLAQRDSPTSAWSEPRALTALHAASSGEGDPFLCGPDAGSTLVYASQPLGGTRQHELTFATCR